MNCKSIIMQLFKKNNFMYSNYNNYYENSLSLSQIEFVH